MLPDNRHEITGESSYGYKFSDLYDSLNRKRTRSLFWETARKNDVPLFTTKDFDITRDGIRYPSLKRIYLSYNHVPGFEYEFALDLFNSWAYWENLCVADKDVSEFIKEWKLELDIRNKAKNIKAIMQQADENVQAAKYLVDKGYEVKRPGRVSKEEIQREKQIKAQADKTLQEDMARLGIKVVK